MAQPARAARHPRPGTLARRRGNRLAARHARAHRSSRPPAAPASARGVAGRAGRRARAHRAAPRRDRPSRSHPGGAPAATSSTSTGSACTSFPPTTASPWRTRTATGRQSTGGRGLWATCSSRLRASTTQETPWSATSSSPRSPRLRSTSPCCRSTVATRSARRSGMIGNLNAAEAVELALAIGASTLVPYHWDGFVGNTVRRGGRSISRPRGSTSSCRRAARRCRCDAAGSRPSAAFAAVRWLGGGPVLEQPGERSVTVAQHRFAVRDEHPLDRELEQRPQGVAQAGVVDPGREPRDRAEPQAAGVAAEDDVARRERPVRRQPEDDLGAPRRRCGHDPARQRRAAAEASSPTTPARRAIAARARVTACTCAS